MNPLLSSRSLLAILAGLSSGAVAAALLSQHVWDMLPCAWCVLQRLVFVAVALAAGLGLIASNPARRRISALLCLCLAGLGLGIALWQHFVANASASCNMTLADRVMGATGLDRALPEVFAAYASCADAKVDLLGLPYEFWSALLFTALAGVAIRLLMKPA